jgi:hypothetical protein
MLNVGGWTWGAVLLAEFIVFYLCSAFIITAIRVLLKAVNHHRNYRLRVTPECRATSMADLPMAFLPTFGEWIGQLESMGFTAVANVTMHEPMAREQVTHCLLVNRSDGVRATIMCVVAGGKYMPRLTFVSEAANGTAVRTSNTLTLLSKTLRQQTPVMPNQFLLELPGSTPLKELYDRHQAEAAMHLPPRVARMMPPEGHEVDFITERHAAARALRKLDFGYALDETGFYYRPVWWNSLRIAFATDPFFRRLLAPMMTWAAKRRLKKEAVQE